MLLNKKLMQVYLSNNHWDFGNDVLYKLCRDYPDHKRKDIVIAKIWLIGRSYAAAIERRKNAVDNNDDFYVKEVAPKLVASNLDSYLFNLKNKDIDQGTMADILKLHKYLSDTFQELTGLNKRSLASKYLHFHRPDLFFIYDSRALKALRIFKKHDSCIKNSVDFNAKYFDKEYFKFFTRALSVKKYIQDLLGNKITVRDFDKILVGIADSGK